MQDAGDLVARRFDMSKHALTIPLVEGWTQEEIQVPFQVGASGSFQLSLTGCKAGDLRKLRIWFTRDGDVSTSVPAVNSPNFFYSPTQVQFSINGLIYLDSQNGSWLLTNLLRRRQPPVITYSSLQPAVAPSVSYTALPASSAWLEVDLAQPYALGDSCEVALVHGVPVMNSVLNLTGTMPVTGSFTAHIEYVLNCSWMASKGSAEFVF
jgi:hypothetical protein